MIAALPKERSRLIFWMLLLAHIYFLQIYPNFISTTEFSRFLLVSAIVDDRTIQVDQAIKRYGDCQDKAIFEGHAYSDKSIGPALIGMPVYAVLRVVGALFSLQWDARTPIFLLRLFCGTIPALFFLRVLTGFWSEIGSDRKWTAILIFVFLFGTIAFPYSQQFTGHHLMGMSLFLSFYFLYRANHAVPSRTTRNLILGGAFSGAAVLCEYPAVFPVAVLFFYMIWTLPKRTGAIWYVVGAIPFLVAMLLYNFSIFGTPFDVTYRHMADPTHTVAHDTGFIGFGLPSIEGLKGLLISRSRGLFFFSPVLLFSLPGFTYFFKDQSFRKEAWLFAGVTITIAGFHSGMSNWDGGRAIGPRYLTSAIPFLITAIVFFFKQERISKIQLVQESFALMSLWSVLVIVIGTVTFPFPPVEIDDPFFKLNLPLLLNGAFGKNLGSLLPSFGTVILFLTILLMIFLILTDASDSQSPNARSIVRWSVRLMIIAVLFLGGYWRAQNLTAFDYFARGSVYFYLGKYENSLMELQTGLTHNPDAHELRLIQLRIRQVSQKQHVP